MSKKVKTFVIVIGIIVVVVLAFTYFGSTSAPSSADVNDLSTSAGSVPLPTGGNGVTSEVSNTDFSALLSSINSISLDTSIFSNPAYEALKDNPITLGTAVIGRVNPFAPIGTDANSTTQNPDVVSVQTLTPSKVTGSSAEFGALVTTQSTDPVTVVFQYGTDTTLGSSTGPLNVTKSGTALFNATGLTPATTYYVNAVAVQGSTTANGTMMTFTTANQ